MPSSVPHVVIPDLEPLKLEDGKAASVLTLSDSMCKYPIGDPACSIRRVIVDDEEIGVGRMLADLRDEVTQIAGFVIRGHDDGKLGSCHQSIRGAGLADTGLRRQSRRRNAVAGSVHGRSRTPSTGASCPTA